MTRLISLTLLGCILCSSAFADIWKWVDANGDAHYVDSKTPIYTWLDEFGRTHYSDTPDHDSAVLVKLVWHSRGSLPNSQTASAKTPSRGKPKAPPGETEGERFEREQAEAYYCKRATEIYKSYLSAPRLYDTDADGNRVYLSEEDGKKLLAETKTKVSALCG